MKLRIIPIIVTLAFIGSYPIGMAHADSNTTGPNNSDPSSCHLPGEFAPACRYFWNIVGQKKLDTLAFSKQQFCVGSLNTHDTSGYYECDIQTSTAVTWGVQASLTGSWPVGVDALTASVNYSVTKTTSLTQGGVIYYYPYEKVSLFVYAQYNDRYLVKQQRHMCTYGGGRSEGVTYPKAVACYPPENVFAYATTEKYDGTLYNGIITHLKH